MHFAELRVLAADDRAVAHLKKGMPDGSVSGQTAVRLSNRQTRMLWLIWLFG